MEIEHTTHLNGSCVMRSDISKWWSAELEEEEELASSASSEDDSDDRAELAEVDGDPASDSDGDPISSSCSSHAAPGAIPPPRRHHMYASMYLTLTPTDADQIKANAASEDQSGCAVDWWKEGSCYNI
ncbi:hypothetical protein E2562_019283 [Oryza meyeriana var. granulata]|uniref:Uncharacterized protein n=1 Tax=Oryza meyeriana var. granulata TaxID=110450 RepID=A0A6G1FA47_9ORYZ|nr:hypothetical protein E2562_019283 [Oryza meyeriana var. granulata]